MSYIFISYRSTQRDIAKKISGVLYDNDIKTWLDYVEIQPGEDWVDALAEGVTQAAAILPVLSPEYVRSIYCQRELKRADSLQLAKFPVLYETLSNTELPIVLQGIQHVDIRSIDNATNLAEALKPIIKKIKDTLKVDASLTDPRMINAALPLPKRVEDKLEKADNDLKSYQAQSVFEKRKVERLQERVNHLMQQWEAANNQLDSELSRANRIILQKQIELIEKDSQKVNQEIDKLS